MYVEAAQSQKVFSLHTYTIFVAMDPSNNYQPLSGEKMCLLFKNTDLRCLTAEDCALLAKVDVTPRIECPYTFGNSNGGKTGKSKSSNTSGKGTQPWIYGVGSVFVIAIIVVMLVCFVLRRRKGKKVRIHLAGCSLFFFYLFPM